MRRSFGMLLVCAVLAAAPAGPAELATPAEFARIVRDAGGAPVALQVAVVSYAPAGGPRDFSVDLIGAIHVADAAYYAGLNERFRDYDSLLFEMVVPDDGDPARTGGGMSFISVMQNGMKDMLGLAYQLDEIDYSAPNFVHADLSTGALAERMQERNESLYVYFWRLVFASFEEYAKDPLGLRDWQLLGGLLANGEDDALKITIAEELLASMESGDIFGGEDGSAIIAARNEHAVDVLKQEIDAGTKRIGIFYGVAHMADFERRLDALALVRTGIEWVDAWRFGSDPEP